MPTNPQPEFFLLLRHPDPPRGSAYRLLERAFHTLAYALAWSACALFESKPKPAPEQREVTPAMPPAAQRPPSMPYWSRSGVWPVAVSFGTERIPAPTHEATRPIYPAHPQPPRP